MSLCTSGHRSCKHRVDWHWETKDGCAGTFCHECLRAVGLQWEQLVLLKRGNSELPANIAVQDWVVLPLTKP